MTSTWMHDDPERAAMSTLSDLLGISHFTTSSGGTVRRDFIEAVGFALGADEAELAPTTKDGVTAIAWELARGEDVPPGILSKGGTITNPALEGIIEGIIENGLSLAQAGDESDDAHDGFHDLEDERRRRVAGQAVRQGQNGFRNAVLEAYDNTCAVTGMDLPAALQAAHIAPYRGLQSHAVSNGLCLRSDIHALFDRHMLAINEEDLTVLLTSAVKASAYAGLDGIEIMVPHKRVDRPDREALERHRRKAGFE